MRASVNRYLTWRVTLVFLVVYEEGDALGERERASDMRPLRTNERHLHGRLLHELDVHVMRLHAVRPVSVTW